MGEVHMLPNARKCCRCDNIATRTIALYDQYGTNAGNKYFCLEHFKELEKPTGFER